MERLLTPASMTADTAQTLVYPTDLGKVTVRSFVTPEEIHDLSFGMGTRDFARYRPLITGKEDLVQAAATGKANVTLAIAQGGVIVGAGILEPPRPGERWGRLEGTPVIEVSIIEVSRPWRGRRLAEPILHLLVDHPCREKRILYMVGYSWTWDPAWNGMTTMAYRDMLIRLFAGQGFHVFQTNDPNVMLRPENLFMARIGAEVSDGSRKRFQRIRFGLNPAE